ncbi:TetR/AcrR family transcriptional regulator [Oscillatoria sp. FACHB-1407]|uniref:TetR/AcrR family transcriptional regulator n=1 Tax=Oscillatoria sp. FACHB-1407 TaxID=2692847 RepID=UPI001685E365|nr:TetR/AcrR family transcriptional regulator [Oscillatoria sp. FACHB-1407]MBD2463419.1 TetR/AcrR family transcriptional regulator [Oscillatoria sp. FACHB-1407]
MSKNSKDQAAQSSVEAERSPQRYHHGDLRNALVQAGLEVLADEGISGLNLRKVARKAGVSEAAPYRHFEDKQALLVAIAQDGFQRLTAELQAVLEQTSEDVESQLLAIARAYVQFGLKHPALMREMFSGLMLTRSAYPDLESSADQCGLILCNIILRGQEQGIIQPGNSKAIFSVFWSTMHGLTMLLLEQQMQEVVDDPSRLEPLIQLSIHALCHGLCQSNTRSKSIST